jgi:hypothetical protein
VSLFPLSFRFAERYPLALLASWFVLGSAGQIILHNLSGYTLGDVIGGPYSNTFYLASLNYHAGDLLTGYKELASSLPTHVRANMPGKILFYQALDLLSTDPDKLALLILAISNLGGVLLYFIVSAIYGSRAVALSAFVLYLFIPGKIFFMPLLNIVSVIPVLGIMFLMWRSLDSRGMLAAALAGGCLYAALFFDPLPLFLAPFLAALVARFWWRRKVSIGDLLLLGTLAAVAFFIIYAIMHLTFRFDLLGRLVTAWIDNSEWNRSQGRPYSLWFWFDLIGFLFSAGALSSFLFVVYAAISATKFIRALGARGRLLQAFHSLFEPGPLMLAALTVTLAAIELAGGNRGEVERLWIFLMVFVQVVVAGFCCEKAGPWTVGTVVAGSIIQTAVTISMVAFVV